MSEVRKRVLMQMKKTEILDNYVTVAHYMLYQEYYAFKKNLTDDTETIIENFLKYIDVQKFICMFREHWYRSIYADNPNCENTVISAQELFTYVGGDGITELRNYLRNNDIN